MIERRGDRGTQGLKIAAFPGNARREDRCVRRTEPTEGFKVTNARYIKASIRQRRKAPWVKNSHARRVEGTNVLFRRTCYAHRHRGETSMKKVDPITLAVVRNNLISVANGMQETAFRCAVTTFMYEIMDCCFGLLDEDCGVVAQSHGILLFLGSLGPATKKSVEIIGKKNLKPGDVVISTSPEITGAHPSDALVFTPIFYKGKIVGYATTKSHWQDLGAKDTFPTNSTEAFGEGLRIPPVRLYKKGVLQQEIWDIIKLNSRAPNMVWGDLQAQIAGCRSAEKGITELLDRYGVKTVKACIAEMYRYSRTMIEEAIERIPDGVYIGEDYLDDNGVDPDKPLLVRAAITVKGRGITVDFTGSAPEQRGPMNGILVSTIAASRAAIKALTTPELPANEGFYGAIKVIAPEGSVVNSGPSAPKFLYAWVAQIILDVVNKALHDVLPDKVPALSGADVVGSGFVGVDQKTGRYWGTLTPCIVGQGGDAFADGDPRVRVSPDRGQCRVDTGQWRTGETPGRAWFKDDLPTSRAGDVFQLHRAGQDTSLGYLRWRGGPAELCSGPAKRERRIRGLEAPGRAVAGRRQGYGHSGRRRRMGRPS